MVRIWWGEVHTAKSQATATSGSSAWSSRSKEAFLQALADDMKGMEFTVEDIVKS